MAALEPLVAAASAVVASDRRAPAAAGKASRNMEPIISVRELARTYTMGEIEVLALRGVSFDIYPGEFVAIMGPSGSGKSTLMNLLGCLDTPTDGEYVLDGIPTEELESDMLAAVRNRKIGFVF